MRIERPTADLPRSLLASPSYSTLLVSLSSCQHLLNRLANSISRCLLLHLVPQSKSKMSDPLITTTYGPVLGFRDTFPLRDRSSTNEPCRGSSGGQSPVTKWLVRQSPDAFSFMRHNACILQCWRALTHMVYRAFHTPKHNDGRDQFLRKRGQSL